MSTGPQLNFDPTSLPVAQLESLKFKANQIIESIQTLQRTVEVGGQNVMPSWPDVLSKYNVILSQTHSFSTSLVSPPTQSQQKTGTSPYERIALHPSIGMTDTQLDNELIPLLRNQQTTDVLRMENDTVRRLAQCMVTRGAIQTSGIQNSQSAGPVSRVTHEDVLRECEEIRGAHDRRVERAVRAVTMLKDKFEWKQRVEVEVEEPEELEWDPRVRREEEDVQMANEGDHTMDGDVDEEGQSSDEEDVVEGELTGDDVQTPIATPASIDVDMNTTLDSSITVDAGTSLDVTTSETQSSN
ncbi:hypothetical protein BJ138DRAFT_57749 [Hygrophoropsis aurantiaca]|uniref:Uncharacterized protein n=1 Tax=Hygrophoropsis aurantiaca TaxID=72124 RepID=A0ACB8ARA0_9AGAM|nr:hypothetical protein BJ138DRAFT_57749 [Hygrophoropsis aurantiaca]